MISLLMMFFSIQGAFAQGHGVGNGGDGFQIDGHVYLRDLIEGGSQFNEIKPQYPSMPMGLAAKSVVDILPDVSLEKLATFLTKMEEITPGIAEYLTFAIRMHTWQFVTQPLLPVQDDCQIVDVPDAQFVQIANRMKGTIRVSQAAWDLMNDENRIALLIHEAVYSLVYPAKKVPGECYGPGMKTREITAIFFKPNYRDIGNTAYQTNIARDVDWPFPLAQEERGDAGIYLTQILRKNEFGYQEIDHTRDPSRTVFSGLLGSTDYICRRFAGLSEVPERDSIVLRASLTLRPFMGAFVPYDADFGEQYHLRISKRAGDLTEHAEIHLPADRVSCMNKLRPLLDKAAADL